jgi:hypothetical protein
LYLKKTNLRRLLLHSTGTPGERLVTFCHEFSSLTELVLIENDQIIRKDATLLLRNLRSLHHLNLRLTNQWTGLFGNAIDESVLSEINPINLPFLKSVSIPYCRNIGDIELSNFFFGVRWTSLLHIDISASHITDVFFEVTSSSLGGLKCLSMNRCKAITSGGIRHLARATSLELLEIRDCYKVDDQCLDVLCEMNRKCRLRIVMCEGSGITGTVPFMNFDCSTSYSPFSQSLAVKLCPGCGEVFY